MSAGSSGVYRLPTLVPGVGERRSSCANYSGERGCLSRWVRATWGDQRRRGAQAESHARCPAACPSFSEAPRWAAVAAAHAYGTRHPLAEAAAIEGDTPEGEPLRGRRAVGR